VKINNLVQARTLLQFTLAEYSAARKIYQDNVYEAVHSYLTDRTKMDQDFRDAMHKAIEIAFLAAAVAAWADGGNEKKVLTVDALALLAAYKVAEMSFAASLLVSLRLIKLQESEETVPEVIAQQRADGYAKTLDMAYNTFKVVSVGNRMLTFVGEDGDETCIDCYKYKGKRHRASWWIAHDAIPPNRNFECKGYKCQHVLVDDQGRLFTI
jgi:hypothetical protein